MAVPPIIKIAKKLVGMTKTAFIHVGKHTAGVLRAVFPDTRNASGHVPSITTALISFPLKGQPDNLVEFSELI